MNKKALIIGSAGQDGRLMTELLLDKDELGKIFILRKILAPMGTTESMEFLLEKMKDIIEDGAIVYHTLHPISGGVISEEECAVGIEWTGQAELTESEIATFDALLSQCPDPIPYDAVVWECELQVRLDSLPDLSEQSFNDSISEHPGYPEWCGRVIPYPLSLDDSESHLPLAEEM